MLSLNIKENSKIQFCWFQVTRKALTFLEIVSFVCVWGRNSETGKYMGGKDKLTHGKVAKDWLIKRKLRF